MINLRDVVERYQKLTKKFGEPAVLADFGWSAEETTRAFTALDEDYHISRFLNFSAAQGGEEYSISGNRVTHVSMEEGILSVL